MRTDPPAGAPSLNVSFQSENGGSSTILAQKTDAITLLPDTIEFKAPED